MTTETVMPFEALTLAAVCAELRATVLPARLQKIQQPSANEIILTLYGRSGACRLLISADPRLFRMQLTQQKRENPITPPSFCQVARKYLDGAILAGITMPAFDRVARLHFRTHDDPDVALVAELMGRNSNVVLVSSGVVVRGSLRPSPIGSERQLRPGSTYQDPPGLNDRRDLLSIVSAADPIFANVPTESADARAFLTQNFSGLGRFMADEVLTRAPIAGGIPEALSGLASTIRTEQFAAFSIAGVTGASTGVSAIEPLSIPKERWFARENFSVALDTLYASFEETQSEESERSHFVRTIAKEIVFRERELESARRTITEAARAEEYERAGNNLLAHLNAFSRGQSSIEVPDMYADSADATTQIALDPKRSPQENAASYFDRARKMRDAADYAEGHAVDLEDDLAKLRYLQIRVEASLDESELEKHRKALADIVGAVRAARPLDPAKKTNATKQKPYGGFKIRKFDVNGHDLFIGESAEANDYLTTRMATPTDLWMHVRSAPGAHAILRTGGKPDRMPESVIRRAAEIVAARSGTSVKHAGLVAVDIVEKRYVRKPRGAKAGLVSYERERVVDVEPRS